MTSIVLTISRTFLFSSNMLLDIAVVDPEKEGCISVIRVGSRRNKENKENRKTRNLDLHFSKQGIYQQQLEIYFLHKNLPPTQGNFKDLKVK